MADNGNTTAQFGPSRFVFEADLSDDLVRVPFQELSGLDAEGRQDYRRDAHPRPARVPDIHRPNSATLKRAMVANNSAFTAWYQKLIAGTVEPRTVSIRLLNESGQPVQRWTLTNAKPIKFTGPEMDSRANEVAIESLELTYEHMASAWE